ncbi:MAG: hypothetical protein J5780_05370 [Treponema sp.]|nr:hypothetical protein [Treponema sp.]
MTNKIRLRNLNFLKKAAFLTAVMFVPLTAEAVSPVDFFATESESSDENMIKMTTDLFFSQFQTIDGYSVNDRRKEHYSRDLPTGDGISFYAEIQESPDGQWMCTLNAIKNSGEKNVSSTKKYESYYKILLDAKPSIENLLTNLSGNLPLSSQENSVFENMDFPPSKPAAGGIDSIAGTWGGEKDVEKILILRGGKGFVIFKNGASMNIQVAVEGTAVTVTQTGRSNASFFPDIPRPVALKNAASAEPVRWSLSINSDGTLSGTKNTLLLKAGSTEEVFYGTVNVTWTKR